MRRIYLSAGHSNIVGKDRGAVCGNFVEGVLAVEFRTLLNEELIKLGVTPILDDNKNILIESLRFFKRIVGSRDIAIDIHFNSGVTEANGTEVLIPTEATNFEKFEADVISKTIAINLDIKNRGVKDERSGHHSRLGWLHLNCENLLIEMCFITNENDMKAYTENKVKLAGALARYLEIFIHQ